MQLTSIDITDKNSPQPTEKGKKVEEKEKVPPPPTEEEKKAANRIFRFWKRRKTLKKWWRAKEESRNNKKKRFANGVVMMQLLIVVVCFLMRWFFDIGLMRLNLGIGLYLTLLVWAVTLSSNCQRQILLGLMSSVFPWTYTSAYDNSQLLVLGTIFLHCFLVVVLNTLLKYMRNTLQHTYASDTHGISSRLSIKLFAGFPILSILGISYISQRVSTKYTFEELCKYMPGAYFDKKYTRLDTIVEGKWENCTEYIDLYKPVSLVTVQDIALEQGMKGFIGRDIKERFHTMELVEITLLLLTSQTLLRICRLTIVDILNIRVSAWELTLLLITLLRLITVFVIGSLNLEWLSYSKLMQTSNFIYSLWFIFNLITIIIIIKLVRDADIVVQIEKARDKKRKPKKKLKGSPTVTMILKRRPRQSVMVHSNRETTSIDDIV